MNGMVWINMKFLTNNLGYSDGSGNNIFEILDSLLHYFLSYSGRSGVHLIWRHLNSFL